MPTLDPGECIERDGRKLCNEGGQLVEKDPNESFGDKFAKVWNKLP